jgi:esterase/lipase superfamily enzyme
VNRIISFRYSTNTPQYDWAVYANGEHIGYVWKIPGFTYGNKTMWKASSLTGHLHSDREGTRTEAAKALVDLLEKASVSVVDTHALKHEVRILAAKLSDLMIVEDLTAGEVADVRQKLEDASHKLEIALLAQF